MDEKDLEKMRSERQYSMSHHHEESRGAPSENNDITGMIDHTKDLLNMTVHEQNIFKASFAQLYAKKIEKQVKDDILNLSRRTGGAASP